MTFQISPDMLEDEDEDETPDSPDYSQPIEAEKTVSYQLDVEATPVYQCDSSKCGKQELSAGWPIYECHNCEKNFLVDPRDIARAERRRMRDRKLEADPMECVHCSSRNTKQIGKESCIVCGDSTVTRYDAIQCPCSNCDSDDPAWVNVELF